MKYPKIFSTANSTLTVPLLNGGINLKDDPCNIPYNQLADCNNMLFSDGALTTRPAISDPVAFLSETDANLKSHNICFTYKDSVGTVVSEHSVKGGLIRFFIVSERGVVMLPTISTSLGNFVLTQHKNTLYLFLDSDIFTLNANDDAWQNANSKIYVPCVAVDCKYSGSFDGVFCEPYNLLADSYSLVYTSKNEAWHNPVTDQVLHEMTYLNFFYDPNLSKYKGKTVTAVLTDENGAEHTHSVVLGEDGFGKETNTSDGLYMLANINNITFFTDPEYNQIAYKYKSDILIQNDLTITFPLLEDKERKDKVFKSGISCWFGGGSGIYGGSRLFLCGNSNEPNLVIWSDLNNPLYFPENNFFNVGSTGSVTAIKPQADMLVIFTENEIYYTKYTEDTTITSDDIISGAVYDYFAKSVYFPLTQISAGTGCDCPNSIQLLNNKLTFLNSNGKIYTLQNSNKFNEHNIYEIGARIHKKIKADTSLKTATSVDYNGKYLLLSGKNLYVFDYNCYSYKNDSQDFNTSWHFCTLPTEYYKNGGLIKQNNTLFIMGLSLNKTVFASFKNSKPYDEIIDDGGNTVHLPIFSMFKTKSFSLASQFSSAKINLAELFLKSDSVQSIFVEYGSNNFTKSTQITPPMSALKGNISVKLYPNLKDILQFSLKVYVYGRISVGALSLKGGK